MSVRVCTAGQPERLMRDAVAGWISEVVGAEACLSDVCEPESESDRLIFAIVAWASLSDVCGAIPHSECTAAVMFDAC
jgi:hypothetical protein